MITIITPLYNAEKFIAETIESVLSQTYTNWEMIIVDDCSTDGSVDIARKYIEKDDRVKLIVFEKNQGQAVARNTGICSAKGRYIAFLDSDDVWLPNKIKIQIDFMKQTGAALSYTAYQKIDECGKHGGIVSRMKLEPIYSDLLRENIIGCSTVMCDLRQVENLYMENIKTNEDYTLWLKILKRGYMVRGLDHVLTFYRVRSGSISSNKVNTAINQWRIYRDIEKLGFFYSVYCFFQYVVNGCKKYIL